MRNVCWYAMAAVYVMCAVYAMAAVYAMGAVYALGTCGALCNGDRYYTYGLVSLSFK